MILDYNRYVRNRESTKRVFWRCARYYQTKVRCPGSLAFIKAGETTTNVRIHVTRPHNDQCEDRRQEVQNTSKMIVE